MTYNSGLSAANPNMVYPLAGAPLPHAPTSICGEGVSYDANGNTLTYDVDGPGPDQPRTLIYDGENRPLVILRNGNATTTLHCSSYGSPNRGRLQFRVAQIWDTGQCFKAWGMDALFGASVRSCGQT